jgi:hypothetical protein
LLSSQKDEALQKIKEKKETIVNKMSKIREVEEENKDIDPDGAKRVNNTFTEMNQKRLL